MQFKDVVGQNIIKNKLLNERSSGRTPHAQMFVGPKGSGGMALALAYAQFVNCENPLENDSCGQCPSCIKASKMIHPDIHFAFPVITKKTGKSAISNDYINEFRSFILEEPYQDIYQWLQHINAENKQGNITVEECRDIIRKLSLKTYEAKHKVMIIWMPEYLGHVGNVLLKIIEEPTEGTIFLLVAENLELILNTIISRTQLVKIPPILDEDIINQINKRFKMDNQTAQRIALLSDGNFTETLSIVHQESNINESFLKEWLNFCYKNQKSSIADWVEAIAGQGREKQKNFIRYIQVILRESLISVHTQQETLQRVVGTEKKLADTLAKFLSFDKIQVLYETLTDAYYHIERNANPRILFMNLSLDLVKLLRK